ncbi:MAG TPA: SDR family oxidoreductase [Dehalococcoidia bacterium]|jgi:NAD(P)-dependent dehydrogenase (short-subunit alcohol dehydrogenase family)|nr:SDR family oxidoreductase [Dehalococcoidia bacterium]HIK88538.1 SDR family oxidoreductase [Dehalococcoidia bacterium]
MTTKLLEGKKALITGSRRGIGAGIAQLFAEHGADVGINDVVRDTEADKAIAAVESLGQKASWHQADVGNADDRTRMLDEFVAEHGRIDILVNNAVASRDMHFTEITEEFWDHLVGHALKGYLFMAQSVANRMIEHGHGGSIINISSVHSYRAWPHDGVYGIVKAGLNRMVLSMAHDLAGKGITANCVAPGYIDSRVLPEDQESGRGNDEYLGSALGFVPSRRGGLPKDIAGACVFLASDLGEYVNGQTITVDGGFLAGGYPQDSQPLEPGMPGAAE